MPAQPFKGAGIRAVERPTHSLDQPGAIVVEGAQEQLVLVAEGATTAERVRAAWRRRAS
jgi:hypothetical protein